MFLLVVAVFVAGLVGGERMSVLMITVDDMRPELECCGAPHVKSPNVDRLAAEGVLFEQSLFSRRD